MPDPPSEPGSPGTTAEEAIEGLHRVLRETLSRDLRELGERMRREAREELQRFVEEHSSHLQQLLERPGPGPLRPRSAAAVSRSTSTPRHLLPPTDPKNPRPPSRSSELLLRPPSRTSAALSAPPVPRSRRSSAEQSVPTELQTTPRPWDSEAPSFEDCGRPPTLLLRPATPQGMARDSGLSPRLVWAETYPKVRRGFGGGVTVEDHRTESQMAWAKWKGSRRARGTASESSWGTVNSVAGKVNRASRLSSAKQQRMQMYMSQAKGEEGVVGKPFAFFRFYMHQMVESEYFDYAVGILLLLNAIIIGVQADHMVTQAHVLSEVPAGYKALNLICCFLFAFELLARIYVNGLSFWRFDNEHWKWNWFDAVIVVISFLDELSSSLLRGTKVEEGISSVGVLRLLRLGRLLRLVRMVRLIPELKSMVYLIMASMGSFIWTCVLITILMYCFAIVFTESTAEMVMNHRDADLGDVLHYWGGIARSVLTLFQAMTGGDDWRNFIDVFNRSESSFFLNAVIFSLYIAFTTLVMLNLVTGVFVEGAQRIMREDKHEALMRLASKIFIEADLDSSTCLDKDEFDRLLRSPLMGDFLQETGLRKSEADRLFYVFDEDDSGDLNLMEFVSGCIRMNASAKSVDVAALRYQQKVMSQEMLGRFSALEEGLMSLGELVGGRSGATTPAAWSELRRGSSEPRRGSSELRWGPRLPRSAAPAAAGGKPSPEAAPQPTEPDIDDCVWA